MMQSATIYQEMAKRTANSVYIGVVGPVRTGKSTLIKRFMELQVLPYMENPYRRDRTRDELPQSGSGRTIMTAEPKFIPEEPEEVRIGESSFAMRMIDCVGYMVPGAMGQFEDLAPRMVMTPWFDYAIPLPEAAEIGTRKVITEHATVGIVVTTDGTVTDLPREEYLDAEERVIRELQEIGKPFVVVVNSAAPESEHCRAVAEEIQRHFHVCCLRLNCLEVTQPELENMMQLLLYEFPIVELALYLPPWVDALPTDHPIKNELYQAINCRTADLQHIRQLDDYLQQLQENELLQSVSLRHIDLGTGCISAELQVYRKLFYETVSQRSGLHICDDGDLMDLLTELSVMKKNYDAIAPALQSVRETGYGIVMPGVEELELAAPEIIRQGGRCGLRMKASAPSIHMIRADIETTVSPIVGNEKQSEDMVSYLLQEFEDSPEKLWQSNIFGRSFHAIVSDDLQAKASRMPEESRKKLREALERIINEGSGGLICIIL